MDIATYAIYGLPALAVVTSIVGIAKRSGLPPKWAPAVSLSVGIGTCVAVAIDQGQSVMAGAAIGTLLGAAACGVYDLGKSTQAATRED